jgi:CBS domain-containing protein
VNQQPDTTRAADVRRVREAMQLHVVSVVPQMTVRELIHVLLENSITGAPVVDPMGKVLGVVSCTDVLQLGGREAEIPAGLLDWNPVVPEESEDEEEAAASSTAVPFTVSAAGLSESAFDSYRVAEIMTPVAFTVGPDDTLATAVRMMRQGRIHRLLVMENDFLYGIITPFDILGTVVWE